MNEFILIGHLQVLDEALSSLYLDTTDGKYYLFVRTYENEDAPTYVLCEVNLASIIEYMEGHIGLKQIFSFYNAFYYTHSDTKLNKEALLPITPSKASKLLSDDGLEDMFDTQLAYKSVALKNHIKQLI